MNKWQKFKRAVSNPPPDRLAGIEYRSHFLQGLGISIVCIILLFKGFWYIIFAFIFGVGVSYSQGVSAYQKYKMLKEMQPKEKVQDYHKDISWTRRRDKIIQYHYGSIGKWFAMIVSTLIAYAFLGLGSGARFIWWKLSLFYLGIILVSYFLLYFVLFYHIAYFSYKEKMKDLEKNNVKGGKKNAEKEKTRS